MIQHWQKRGLIFSPSGETASMHSHAAVPIAEHLENNFFKIYFSSRDDKNRSFTNYVIIDITKPQKILEISLEPILSPGKLGTFDDSGAMASWLTSYQNKNYLYYIGWNLGKTIPFRNAIGLAISEEKNCFSRYAEGPVVDRSVTEPHFCASCCVIPDKNCWRMWYLSCISWDIVQGEPQHRYHIKYAESQDGIHWKRDGHIAIDFANDTEYAIARPSVMHNDDLWRMWYSFRGDFYRIGYAESENGYDWKRYDDRVDLTPSTSGWDAEMIEYPYVFDHEGQRYMLYNGNDYGRTGFGIAVLDHFN